MVNRRFYHKIIIVILIFAIFTSSCFASTTSNVIDGMKNLTSVDELYNYIKTTFGSDGSNVTNTFLNAILQTLKTELSTPQNIVWVDFATKNVMGVSGNFRDYMYRDSNTQASIYTMLRDFYNRYYTYSDGNASLLNQINTNTTNMYGAQSASNVQLASLNRKFTDSLWLNTSITPVYYSGLGGSASTLPIGTINQTLYFRIGALRNYETDLYMIPLPIQSNAARYFNDESFTVNFRFDYAPYDIINVDYELNKTVNNTYSYLTFKVPAYGGMYIEIIPKYPLYIASSSLDTVKYMNLDSLGYSLQKIDYDIRNNDNHSDIVNAINDKQLEANVDVTINNTITDNDLTLDVDLPDNATNDTSNLLNKLKQLMLTGVATNQLLNALDDVELHAWYSQENKTIVESINNQYVDLYD